VDSEIDCSHKRGTLSCDFKYLLTKRCLSACVKGYKPNPQRKPKAVTHRSPVSSHIPCWHSGISHDQPLSQPLI